MVTAALQEQAPTQPDSPPRIAGWAGLLLPYNKNSVDGRVVRRPPDGPRIRALPIELKFQENSAGDHAGSIVGLASITKVWETDEGLWGSGEFDTADPKAVALARKIHNGFVGHVSVDLGDFTSRAEQTQKGVLQAVTDWKLLSATIVADAAMDGARIFTVADAKDIVPTATALAARRESAGVFQCEGDKCTLTFANKPLQRGEPEDDGGGDGPDDTEPDAENEAAHARFVITGATNLPWAPRDRDWDASAARARMAEHCGGVGNLNPSCFQRGFMYREGKADAKLVGSYKFPFADVIDGQLRAVFKGVVAAAQRSGQADISGEDESALKSRIRSLYGSAARAFDDESIKAPFDCDDPEQMTSEEDREAMRVHDDDDEEMTMPDHRAPRIDDEDSGERERRCSEIEDPVERRRCEEARRDDRDEGRPDRGRRDGDMSPQDAERLENRVEINVDEIAAAVAQAVAKHVRNAVQRAVSDIGSDRGDAAPDSRERALGPGMSRNSAGLPGRLQRDRRTLAVFRMARVHGEYAAAGLAQDEEGGERLQTVERIRRAVAAAVRDHADAIAADAVRSLGGPSRPGLPPRVRPGAPTTPARPGRVVPGRPSSPAVPRSRSQSGQGARFGVVLRMARAHGEYAAAGLLGEGA